MITFLSLFLSLVAGPQTLEVAAGPQVAGVEWVLDGQVIGSLTQAPWTLEYDFGKVLAPRELVARALDEKGEEIGRARQLLNVPRSRAEASLAVLGSGGERRARLSWKTVENLEPETLLVELDGQAVRFTDPQSIALPAVEADRQHFLTAEITFPGDLQARAWTTFGGAYGELSAANLTAVPILVDKASSFPDPKAFAGKVRVGAQEARVVAVEGVPADILMIREPSAQEPLLQMARAGTEVQAGATGTDPLPNMPPVLEARDRFNVLATWTAETAGSGSTEPALFPLLLTDRRLLQVGIPTILTRGFAPIPEGSRHRMADAVAAAGRTVAANGRTRAVVLVRSGSQKDASFYTPEAVRHYLQQLGVPLVVWSIAPDRGQGRGRKKHVSDVWGPTTDISTPAQLRQALGDLRDLLDRQRVLWIEGSHLPQTVTLADGAVDGVSLVR
jgi:hypothetical protein